MSPTVRTPAPPRDHGSATPRPFDFAGAFWAWRQVDYFAEVEPKSPGGAPPDERRHGEEPDPPAPERKPPPETADEPSIPALPIG